MPDTNASYPPSYPFLSLPLIKPGMRHAVTGLTGSSDALLVAAYMRAHRAQVPMLAVVCANATDAQRLAEEIPWFAPELRVRLLPDWETLPYDSFSPHQDLVSERLATLHDIQGGQCDVMIVPASTALYRLAPPAFLAAYTFFFKQGERLDESALKAQFTLAGYEHVSAVMRPGEYSVRGGLIDLYPMGSALPYRIDLFGDEIETIRAFDPDTQRSLYPVKEVRLLPGREFPLDDAARTAFRGRWREVFEGDPTKSPIYKDIGNGVPSAGIEYYLPLFFESSATVFDYLPADTQLAFSGNVDDAIRRFWADTTQRYTFMRHDRERPLLPPSDLFLSEEQFFVAAKPLARLVLQREAESGVQAPVAALPDVSVNRRAEDPLVNLESLLLNKATRVLMCADSAGRRETLMQLFGESGLRPHPVDDFAAFLASDAHFSIAVAPLQSGFALPAGPFAFVTEAELYAGTARRAGRRKQEQASAVDSMVRDLAELKVGDPVVHSEHGIGRYQGLVTLDMGNGDEEFLHLDYDKGSKLYVPVHQLHVISRYSGADPDTAPLHHLGTGQWDKAKRRAAQQIRDTAAELLNLYARRALREGFAFPLSPKDYETFAESFGFEETPDQAAAIAAVIADMTSGKPMDRLVCGDVGFGKTEVALRAAFVAVLGGKQVAMLAPTTLLAEQHFQTLSDRFAEWPVRIVELSRFKTKKEIDAAIKLINEGSVDIVIGTHKLLSDEVKFQRLGLVIIDEEHRFGVRQKEALKSLRAEVDVLTLTATPIPRTLGMALEGLRDFSVIATAPQKRLAIKTFVRREEDGVIREAILRELKRGGQVYFLHNEVETIENKRAKLAELVPEARIAVAHGQMHERELERVMRDFVSRRDNILLCTTIIETGIDVPTANTILIHRADKFGLAQLHQLRGRVGRSHHQAYAYLLVHDPEGLTKQAQRRLEAIQQMEELGSGFYLAMHDLEIRGAGEVLGDKQSGEIHEIGFQLYTDMLNAAVKALKAGKEPDLMAPLQATTEINLGTPALLPNDYCADVHERLSLYKRLANCETAERVDDIQEELIDRFGRLPAQAQALVETHRLRIAAAPLGVRKIDAGEASISVQFVPNPPIDAIRIIDLVQKNRHIKLAGQDKLRIEAKMPDVAVRAQTIKHTLRQLA
ncbi:transcription-repair coupling factor [Cupriavidus plantarum]|uniref:Transcription-repair-coupling factor n=1 Tax=Cupriavidus plantarum TaxID=942865 RepID=A0A316EWL8_9BURK|nr:transcription-repair coupling factor [Cupriavidus plantarum]PWK37094.1 transcription-repair coupling factor [Cupriavidus plantarum]RLK44985.1 transcription-repair coupling factor [Cupriavidus plantarum]CAG2130220.1 Transcription-repair-coupling factor [Cupriavidus plantarum]SMR66177.1 transcription-repair coupling factor [Cupriavidus plantarum]